MQQRFLLRFAPGDFCDAFFVGRVRASGTVSGPYHCLDGSGGGLWSATLALPLEELATLPTGDASLQAPPALLEQLAQQP